MNLTENRTLHHTSYKYFGFLLRRFTVTSLTETISLGNYRAETFVRSFNSSWNALHNQWPKALYTQARRLCAALFECGVQSINFLRTWGEERTPGAWRCIQFSLCSRKKTNKFWVVANSMRTIRKQRSADLQSRPNIRAFGLRTIHESFGALMYTRLKNCGR